MKRLIPLVLVFVALAGLCAAGEAESAAPATDAVPWWLTLLTTDAVSKVLGTVLLFLLNALLVWIFGKKWQEGKYAEAVEALKAGVENVYIEQVRGWKAAAEDGKLTPEECAQARQMALDHAKTLARGPALKLLSTWGKDKIASLIADIIAKRKAK